MNFKMRRFLSLLIGCLSATAAETPATSLLVLAKTDRTLAIVDPVTRKVIARMPSGQVTGPRDATPCRGVKRR